MKLFLLLPLLLSSFSLHAYTLKTDCTAYSANGDKLEIKGAKNGLSLFYNGSEAGLISSSTECAEDLECNFVKGYGISFIEPSTNTGAHLQMNVGEILAEINESFRGGVYQQSVVKISPVVRILRKNVQMEGTCLKNY